MTSYFDTLLQDYENAEISCVVLHDRKAKQWRSFLTVIELIPAEQEPSTIIGQASTGYCDRQKIDDDYTVYVARRIACPVSEAITIFKEPEKGILLQHGGELYCNVTLLDKALLEAEPSSEYPLVINAGIENTIGAILPKRQTAFRVWTKIDRQKRWLEAFTVKQREKLFAKAGLLTKKYLGFDISILHEHGGNIYLCACNPYLRRFDKSLLDLNQELLVSFQERSGRSIIGKKLILEDVREGNTCFSLELTVNQLRQRIRLPHFPDMLYAKLYDSHDHLIENHAGRWINFSFQMKMQTAQLNLTVKEGTQKRKLKIAKYSSERPVQVGQYDHSLTSYLKEKQRLRQRAELEKNGQFIFFPGSFVDKEKARNAIAELLNKASKVCMLLDPYFGAPDLYYAYLIQNTSLPIQIISSAAFLKSKSESPSGRKMKQAFLLRRALAKYKRVLPHQFIEVKVLPGGKSPLHDRYIVVDENVYLLGSSFNEFGSRATTLIKVPDPLPMVTQAMNWWTDVKTKSLDEYIKSLKSTK